MANLKSKKKSGIINLKIVVEKLQKSLLTLHRKSSASHFEELCDSGSVPADVKEGHFAVIAVDDDELRKFVVPLSFLTHPAFLRLLEQAAEEYGFDHDGALTVPCRLAELERILAERWNAGRRSGGDGGVDWSSCNNTRVRSC